jgi:hypothetical protein
MVWAIERKSGWCIRYAGKSTRLEKGEQEFLATLPHWEEEKLRLQAVIVIFARHVISTALPYQL